VGSAVLRTGDRLRIGGSVFVVTESDDPSGLDAELTEGVDEHEHFETVVGA
jgi:hypothetical protein